jgi:hypothetical protein
MGHARFIWVATLATVPSPPVMDAGYMHIMTQKPTKSVLS